MFSVIFEVLPGEGKKVTAYRLRFTPPQRGDFVFVLETPPIWMEEEEEFFQDTVKVVLHVKTQNGWDAPTTLPLDIMSADELVELRDRGFEVASHGHAHIDLGRVTPAVAEQDVATSVQQLTEILGSPPRHFAYPYGRSSKTARSAVARAGFELAFSLDRGEEDPSRLALPRTPIFPHDRRWLYGLKTSGRYRTIRYAPPVKRGYDLVRPLIRGGRFWP